MPETINTVTASLGELRTFAINQAAKHGNHVWQFTRMMVNIYVGYLDAGYLNADEARHMAASVVQSALDNS